jgi:hypothetical protein
VSQHHGAIVAAEPDVIADGRTERCLARLERYGQVALWVNISGVQRPWDRLVVEGEGGEDRLNRASRTHQVAGE